MREFWKLWLILCLGVMAGRMTMREANAQTPEAKRAVVKVQAVNQSYATGVLVSASRGRYVGLTAGHVIESRKTVPVVAGGQSYTATVIESIDDDRGDVAAFQFDSRRKLTVVPIADRDPADGERLWSAGYAQPADGRLVVRQGRKVPLNPFVSFRIVPGDSGAPVFSSQGVVGVLVGYVNGEQRGTVTGESYYTPCRIFGRRSVERSVDVDRSCEINGTCGLRRRGDQGTTDPGPIIDTPIGEPEPVLLPPVVDRIADDIESIDENVDGIHSVLTEPPPEPKSILPVLLVLGAAGGVVLVRHFRK